MKYKSTIAKYIQPEKDKKSKKVRNTVPDPISMDRVWSKMRKREDGVWVYSGNHLATDKPKEPLEPKPEPKRPAAMRKKREIDYVTVEE